MRAVYTEESKNVDENGVRAIRGIEILLFQISNSENLFVIQRRLGYIICI